MRFLFTRMRERARTSLWILPGIATLVAVALSQVLPILEGRYLQARVAWYLFAGEPDSARALLSTIASSMMTFTGLVFSITILVLQLASSQFSPRVLRTFLEDGPTRTAMATFVGTFVYSMALLPQVRSAGAVGGEQLPALSVFLAFALVIVSVAIFIRYIHRMAHSIRTVRVIRRIAQDASESIEELYPEDGPTEEPPTPCPNGAPSQVIVHRSEGGVIAAVDDATLLALAARADAVIALVPELGDFVPRESPLFRIWAAAPLDEREVLATLAIEEERTPHQDPAFAIRQLVDVAERALSPGINDPTTAVQSIDRIHDLLVMLARRRFPPSRRLDDEGRLRLLLPRPQWDDLVRLAFDEIRHYGKGSIQVVRRLRAALLNLQEVCPPSRRPVLELELAELDRLAATQFPFPDRARALVPSAQGQGAALDPVRGTPWASAGE